MDIRKYIHVGSRVSTMIGNIVEIIYISLEADAEYPICAKEDNGKYHSYTNCGKIKADFDSSDDINIDSVLSNAAYDELMKEKELRERDGRPSFEELIAEDEHVELDFGHFEPVIVRDDDNEIWGCDLFSHKNGDIYCCVGGDWKQCLPYNHETKHLVGTINK